MNKKEIKKIPKIEKNLLDKIKHILGSELNCDEYDIFYNYFNEIKKPNILVEIKDCEEIINCMKKLQQENKQLKERIDKAIVILNAMKHIENLFKMGGCEKTNVDKILEILKGDK